MNLCIHPWLHWRKLHDFHPKEESWDSNPFPCPHWTKMTILTKLSLAHNDTFLCISKVNFMKTIWFLSGWREPRSYPQVSFPRSITVTSLWARWRLISPASRWFTQPFVQAQIKEIIKAPRHWLLREEFTGDWWNPRSKGQFPFDDVIMCNGMHKAAILGKVTRHTITITHYPGTPFTNMD